MKYLSLITILVVVGACSDSKFKGGVAASPPTPATADTKSASGPAATIPTAPTPPSPGPAPDLTSACTAGAANLKSKEQTLSYAARKSCKFGVAPNLAERNGYIQAVETSAQTLQLPPGRICDISIESAKGALLNYDDMLVLTLENNLLFSSTENLLPFLDQKEGIYQWDFAKVVGQKPKEFGGKSYCIGDSAQCVIPETEKTGPVSVNLPISKIAPISASLAGKTDVTLNLIASGDNDPTDCAHTQLDVIVTFKYIP